MSYPKIPLVQGIVPSQNATARYAYVRNTSGGELNAGDVLIVDVLDAVNGLGQYPPVTTVAGDDSDLVCGVVPLGQSSIPDDAKFFMQVIGLHTAVKVNGDADIVNGDDVSSSAKGAGIAKKASGVASRFGVYVDGGWADDATALHKVILHPPFVVPWNQ